MVSWAELFQRPPHHPLPQTDLSEACRHLWRIQTSSEKGEINAIFQIWKQRRGKSKEFTRSVIQKLWSRDPLETLEILSGIQEVKTIFILILRCYLPFVLSFFCKCTVEFSKGYMMYDITADRLQKWLWESGGFLFSQTVKRFAKLWNNAILLPKHFSFGIYSCFH